MTDFIEYLSNTPPRTWLTISAVMALNTVAVPLGLYVAASEPYEYFNHPHLLWILATVAAYFLVLAILFYIIWRRAKRDKGDIRRYTDHDN